MRPTKLGLHIIEAFKQVLASDEDIVLMCTDDDLLYMLNKQLDGPDQISYRSFQRYKALALDCGMEYEYLDPDDVTASYYYEPVYKELYILFRDALIKQKQSLMRKVMAANNNFELRKWQWILERKFREWNLRYTAVEAERAQKAEGREEDCIEHYFKEAEKQDQDYLHPPALVPVYISPEGDYHVDPKYRGFVHFFDINNLPPKWDGPRESLE